MKKLIIDLDDVICDGGFLALVNKFLDANYTLDDVKGYYIQSLIDDDRLDEFYEFLLEKNMYNYVNIMPHAVEVIEKLNNKYDLYICSSFVIPTVRKGLGLLIENKAEWIRGNLPFLKYDQMIFMSQKQLINADIRIDDQVKNLDGKAELRLLFTSHHNKGLTNEELSKLGITRVNDWNDVEDILL